ncbi:MAG TPA: hypothetical protein VGO45_10980 [Bacteroidia bacterium]|jgi:hypothetical protein|nr:hypothetical protein [Bacteroidia bacterium]
MKQYILIPFLCFFLITALSAHPHRPNSSDGVKDTLILMNGLKLAGDVLDTAYQKTTVKYVKKNGKEKTVVVDNDLIFSILYRNGREKIIYEQDTVSGNYFTPDETRLFIYGERDAEKHYHSPITTIASIAIGVGSGYFGSILCLIPPFAFSGIMLIPKIKIKYKTVSTPEYLNFDTYVLGYEKVARKKKLFHSLIGGIGGLAVSLFSFQVLFQNI